MRSLTCNNSDVSLDSGHGGFVLSDSYSLSKTYFTCCRGELNLYTNSYEKH